MPGGAERVLRRRIGSVRNTKKITRAMELIAATRVARAQQRANAARPYAEQLTSVIEDLAAGGADVDHPLLRQVENPHTIAFIVCAGDRGLAGPYNSAVIRTGEREIQAHRAEGGDYKIISVGRKARDYFAFRAYEIDSYFSGFTDNPRFEDAHRIARRVRELFESGPGRPGGTDLHRIRLARHSTSRRSAIPPPRTHQDAGPGRRRRCDSALVSFSFEPSPEGVLEDLLPQYVEARLFAALLDAAASEHANRQRAMKAATENADELITKLARDMNRARQASITTEIMEIVGGAEALEDDAA